MMDLSTVSHHRSIEAIASVVCAKTQNMDRGFYNVIAAYFLSKMAATMRVQVAAPIFKMTIPVNNYVIALGNSGMGKGYSVTTIENEFLNGFKAAFMGITFPEVAEEHLWDIAYKRAVANSSNEQEEKEKIDKEFRNAGALPFTFDSATVPAVKQLRHKLLMANSGAINFQIDEIGLNLVKEMEVFAVFLELFDQGMVKNKLVKNTAENQRGEELDGRTPANMLAFGTPSKLLDGGATEEAFLTLLETGYARRCLFGIGALKRASRLKTAEQLWDELSDSGIDSTIQYWRDHFTTLADRGRYNWTIKVPKEVGVQLLQYKIDCERLADDLPEYQEIQRSELSHRYFKALKLAGTYAFIDESLELEMDHLFQAIKLVEESGDCLKQILNRDPKYVRVAKYLAAVGTPQTHADIMENLSFYGQSGGRRSELLSLAQAWGVKHGVTIKKQFLDGIEFIEGEALKATDMNKLTVSYSTQIAAGYRNDFAPFDKLDKLVTMKGYHWCNHHFENNYRTKENAIPGFDMIVVDVDDGTPLHVAHDLLKQYTFMTYTTKRHQVEDEDTGVAVDRYRLILPMNYRLTLDNDDYEEFMDNVMKWLPFRGADEQANQTNRKWLAHDGALVHKNEADLIDVFPFIPRTAKNETFKTEFEKIASLDNLERWFAERMSKGNRNNNLAKYAFALCDQNLPFQEIEARVLHLNTQIANPLKDDEIQATVMVSVARRLNGQP